MNQARTHSSTAMAFRQTTDYSCALTVYLSPWSRISKWVKQTLGV